MKIKAGKHTVFHIRFAAYSYTRSEDFKFCLPTFGVGREDGMGVIYIAAFFWAAGVWITKVEE